MGIEETSNTYYFSTLVSNRLITYEEYYKISKISFDLFLANELKAKQFAEECGYRLHDSCLFFTPSSDRGQAC